MKIRLALIGGGSNARQLIAHLRNTNEYVVAGIFDDTIPQGTIVDEIPVLGCISDLSIFFQKKHFQQAIITIGYANMARRNEVYNKARRILPLANFIHPTATIAKDVMIGDNVIVMAGCIIDVRSHIGNNIFFHVGTIIAHDTVVEDNVITGPGVVTSGFCSIGNNTFIGTGTVLRDCITIGRNCVVGAGSLVVKDIPENTRGYGAPFRMSGWNSSE